jgi:S-DNA-T family DNA segregation ATPase FtsK/SpoIIIE
VSIVRAIRRELAWWLGGFARLLRRHPAGLLGFVGVALLYRALGVDMAPVWGALAVLLGLAFWCRVSPASFRRLIGEPMRRRRVVRRVRQQWPSLMDSCGLVVTDRVTGSSRRTFPALGRPRWDRHGDLTALVGLVNGQTVADFEAVADRLRTAVDARGLRVVPNERRTGCRLVWSFTDSLAGLVDFVGPNPIAAGCSIDSVLIGRAESGDPFLLDLRVSTLTVGVAGAGKASVMWNVILGQAPNIRSGLVEYHGADLKGSMELTMGAALFTRLARTSAEAAVMLEETAAACDARAARLAGVTRLHQPTRTDPMVIVLIDELAVLVAYETDRELLKRVDAALRRILAVGRAVGYYVFAFVQDPRKETIGMRHMFPQKVSLRLDEAAEVDMVLGEGARRRGAEAHHISRSTPGVGFAVNETGEVERFRAAYVTDALIRLIASTHPAPRQVPIVVPEPPEKPQRASRSRSRGQEDAA